LTDGGSSGSNCFLDFLAGFSIIDLDGKTPGLYKRLTGVTVVAFVVDSGDALADTLEGGMTMDFIGRDLVCSVL
jgi:hypothetical protein